MLHQNIRDSNMAMIYLADGAPLIVFLGLICGVALHLHPWTL